VKFLLHPPHPKTQKTQSKNPGPSPSRAHSRAATLLLPFPLFPSHNECKHDFGRKVGSSHAELQNVTSLNEEMRNRNEHLQRQLQQSMKQKQRAFESPSTSNPDDPD